MVIFYDAGLRDLAQLSVGAFRLAVSQSRVSRPPDNPCFSGIVVVDKDVIYKATANVS